MVFFNMGKHANNVDLIYNWSTTKINGSLAALECLIITVIKFTRNQSNTLYYFNASNKTNNDFW